MQSTSLGSHRLHMQPVTPRRVPPYENAVPNLETVFDTTGRCTLKSATRIAILVLYSSVTVLDLVRGVIHTFLYDTGLEDISGLATGDALVDGRLSALMIAYGGANLESFIVRSSILYMYARYDLALDLVRVSSVACVLWTPVTEIVSSVGDVDVGDAEVPGRYAMLIRALLSLGALLFTFV